MDSTEMTITGLTLARLPLIQRSRPPGLPLETRVAELRDLTDPPGADSDHDLMIQAAEICNKAALIASDCGLPDLARSLCWAQYEAFDQARPVAATAAKLALQPLLNLPRQLIRQGDGDSAYALLEALFHAARDRTDIVIDGRRVSLRNLTRAPDDQRTICTLIWAAFLADGTRALTQTGRWQQATEHVTAHRGLGARLLDGRQVTIAALIHTGDTEQAASLIEESYTPEPWEQAIQSLLRVLCLRAAGANSEQHTSTMLTEALATTARPAPLTAVFVARVGLSALELADGYDDTRLSRLRAQLIAIAQTDAYAARDALTHLILNTILTDGECHNVTAILRDSGLDSGTIPEPLYDNLLAAAASAKERLRGLLTGATTSPT